MGQNDLGAKEFFLDPENMASFINGVTGQELVSAEDIQSLEETVLQEDDAVPGQLNEGRRDILCRARVHDTVFDFILIGIENQTTVDPHLPFRAMGYDAGTYRRKMKDEKGRILPVFTFVLYFGLTRWTGPRTLRGGARDSRRRTWSVGAVF